MQKSLSADSARLMIEKVERLRKEGKTLDEATQACGTSVHVFGYWKSKLKVKRTYKRRKAIQVEAAPAPHIVGHFVLFSDGNIANLSDLKRAA
jgi:uncharacterized protein (UPF0335 family)